MEQSARLLTLHIGAHKTGTTVLQNHVFPYFSGYIGKFENEKARAVSNSFSNRDELEAMWLEVYRLWVLNSSRLRGAVQKWIEHLVVFEESSILVSSEEFHSWPARGNRIGNFLSDGWFKGNFGPPHPFLLLLQLICDESKGQLEVRVIFTVRNQVDYLGSRYAQQSISLSRPCQADFDKRFQKVIQSTDPYLDWAHFVEDLHRVAGRSNVLVLIYEDGVGSNVEKLLDYLGWEGDFSNLPRENVKRLGRRRWTIRSAGFSRTGLYGILFWFLFTHLSFGGPVRNVARAAVKQLEHVMQSRKEPSRSPAYIEIDDQRASALLKKYAGSNRRLSKLLGRDLSKVGYLP